MIYLSDYICEENVETICWRNIFNNDDDDTRERHIHSTLGTVQMNILILYHYRDGQLRRALS